MNTDLPDDVDPYLFLGLPTGEEGANLTLKEINKAYRVRALILHPDKNPNDPNANANFNLLKVCYETLRKESTRKEYDSRLRARREEAARVRNLDAKRRRMVSDLEERERGASGFADDPDRKRRRKDEETKRKLKEEVRKMNEMRARQWEGGGGGADVKEELRKESGSAEVNLGLDRSRVLKASWESGGSDIYTAAKLRELFEEFGEVEDVLIRGNNWSAFVVMASKDGVDLATNMMIGDLSNPLLVLPLQPDKSVASVRAQEPVATNDDPIGSVVGAGFQAFENSVLEKIRKKAAQLKK